jgi:hypothetical protein
MASLVLTPDDGTATLDILDQSNGIYLARDGSEDLLASCAEFEEEWASSPDSEGAFAVRSKPLNIVRSGRVFIKAATETALEAKVLTWLQTLNAMRDGGTAVYTSDSGAVATLEVLKAAPQRVGQDPILRARGHAESSFTLTCEPYWLLPSESVAITALTGTQTNATTVTSTEPLLSFLAPDPGGSVPARVKLTLTDTEPIDRSHVEGGVDSNYDSEAPVLFDTNPAITLTTSAAADNIVDTTTAHGFTAGTRVRFLTLTGGTGLSTGVVYYVISANLAAQTFQVSTTSGGSAVDFSSDITAGTVIRSDNLGPLAGTSNTSLTGEYGSETIRATLTTTPVAICDSGPQVHVGTWRHKPRLWGAGTGPIWVRLAYKVGSSPSFQETDWVQLPALSAWYELDLGLMSIREPVQGTQSCEWRIEAYSETPGDTLDVDYDLLIPQSGFKARTPFELTTPTSFLARDEFDQTAGALTGKTAAAGGVWAGAGDADDVSVNATAHTADRTAISDADVNTGRYLISGAAAATDVIARVEWTRGSLGAGSDAGTVSQSGLLVRYVDTSNWLKLVVSRTVGATDADFIYSLDLIKRVAGTVTTIATYSFGNRIDGKQTHEDTWALDLTALASGTYSAAFGSAASGAVEYFSGVDSALATGGALASGKVGFYDVHTSARTVTRTFDYFIAYALPRDYLLYSGRDLEVRSDQILREHSSGEWGRVDSTGGYPTLPPGQQSRIVVKARRNDTDELPDDTIDDGLAAQLEITPRVPVL